MSNLSLVVQSLKNIIKDALIQVLSDKKNWRKMVSNAPKIGRTILIVEQEIPKIDQNAGARNIFMFMEVLSNEGWNIFFWPEDNTVADHIYIKALSDLGVNILSGKGRPRLSNWLKSHEAKHLSHVLLCRPDVAFRYTREFSHRRNFRLVYYGHDLHYARLAQQAAVSGDSRHRKLSEKLEKIEAWIWKRVDTVTYPTAEEVSIIRHKFPEIDAKVVSIFSFDDMRRHSSRPTGFNIVFVGGFKHEANIDAVRWLLTEIWPEVVALKPHARLRVIGSSLPQEIYNLQSVGVEILGHVTDEQLRANYADAQLAIVPLRFGAGLKLKVVEALVHGLPVVTTDVGIQGLIDHNDAIVVGQSVEELAAGIYQILQLSSEQWISLSNEAASYAEKKFSRRAMADSLLRALA